MRAPYVVAAGAHQAATDAVVLDDQLLPPQQLVLALQRQLVVAVLHEALEDAAAARSVLATVPQVVFGAGQIQLVIEFDVVGLQLGQLQYLRNSIVECVCKLFDKKK